MCHGVFTEVLPRLTAPGRGDSATNSCKTVVSDAVAIDLTTPPAVVCVGLSRVYRSN
jgi:hypothetical protein